MSSEMGFTVHFSLAGPIKAERLSWDESRRSTGGKKQTPNNAARLLQSTQLKELRKFRRTERKKTAKGMKKAISPLCRRISRLG